MEILAARQASHLYWMGRYIQRAYGIASEVINIFDLIIDKDFSAGNKFFNKLGIEIEYDSANSFLKEAIFGNHPSSVYGSIKAARENAVICRHRLQEKNFAVINNILLLFQNNVDNNITVSWLENSLDGLFIFWGDLDLQVTFSIANSLLRLGRYVEKIDLNLRIYNDTKTIKHDLYRLNNIMRNILQDYEEIRFDAFNVENEIDKINSMIYSVISI